MSGNQKSMGETIK